MVLQRKFEEMMLYEELLQGWELCRLAREDGEHMPLGAIPLHYRDDFGYITQFNGRWTIVIDGTNHLSEWLSNMMWFRTGRFKMAKGFRNVAYNFYEQVIVNISKTAKVKLIGHSRGGAVAQSLALIMANRGYNIDKVLTYGSPKVGGRKFCRSMRDRDIQHIRVVAKKDIVTKLPFVRGKHYDTTKVLLKNDIKGIIKRHLAYGELINGLIHDI